MFSVLMPVCYKCSPVHFRAALASLAPQLPHLNEVVLVKDGPLGLTLEAALDAQRALLPLRVVALPKNAGLAGGGLRYARSELAPQAFLWREGVQSAWSSLLVGCACAALSAAPPALRQLVYRRALRSPGA